MNALQLFAALSLSFLSLAPSSLGAEASLEFLSVSPLLKAAKLNIVPVEQSAGGHVLLQVMWEGNESGHLLGNDGKLHKLELVKGAGPEKTSVKMCGETHSSPPRKIISGEKAEGRFALLGKLPTGFRAKWVPAVKHEATLPAACTAHKKGWTLGKSAVSTVEGVKPSLFFVELDGPGLEKRRAELAGKAGAECDGTAWQLQRVGTVEGKKCGTLLQAPLNCEGQGLHQGTVGAPLGMIELAKGKAKEQWIVFEATGYEGTAFLGIRLTNKRPAPKAHRHFYVFSGC